MTEDTNIKISWNKSLDKMLAEWCDQSKCFNWMHTESYSRYSNLATVMSITTNIIISLSGIANLIVGNWLSVTETPIIFGCISISVGIINMIHDKFNWSILACDFKKSAEKWGMITRKIQEILIFPPQERKDCSTFLKYIKEDINDASLTNELIPKDIRQKCIEAFGNIKDFDVPDICGQIEHTRFYEDSITVPLLF